MGWPKLMKEFLVEAFDKDLASISANKPAFIALVKETFPGSAMSIPLLNAYICMYRKKSPRLQSKPRSEDIPRIAFHKDTFLKLISKEAHSEKI